MKKKKENGTDGPTIKLESRFNSVNVRKCFGGWKRRLGQPFTPTQSSELTVKSCNVEGAVDGWVGWF